MKTTTQILPGVKSIGWVDCSLLMSNVALAGICHMPVPILTTIHPIDFFDEPQCDCKTKRDGASYEDTASLKFLCAEELAPGIDYGFVVTDVNDRSFLIGSKERPVPVAQPQRKLGSPSGDSAGCYYEISHVAIKSLIPCIVAS